MNDIEKHVLQKRVDEQRDYDKAKEIAPKLLEQCRSEEMTMRQVELAISIMQTMIKERYSSLSFNVLMKRGEKMERADLESILDEINGRTNRTVEAVYESLREKSNTYGELKKNIVNVSNQVKWGQPDLAVWLSRELMARYENENGKMPLQ